MSGTVAEFNEWFLDFRSQGATKFQTTQGPAQAGHFAFTGKDFENPCPKEKMQNQSTT